MFTVAPTITNAGRSLQVRAIAGEAINFTRFQIGSGIMQEGDNPDEFDDLISPELSFGISSYEKEQNFVKFSGSFSNTDLTGSFRWREIGIYCEDPDGTEFLYAYSNDDNNGGWLTTDTDVLITETVSLVVAIGDAEHVTATLTDSSVYATKTALEAHAGNRENPHGVTKEHVGLGNVENVSPTNATVNFTEATTAWQSGLVSGTTLGILFGRVAGAIKKLASHIVDGDAHTSREEKRKWNGYHDCVVGSYKGNGSLSRTIELGFKPIAVLVIPHNSGAANLGSRAVCGGLALRDKPVYSGLYDISLEQAAAKTNMHAVMILDNGFAVGYDLSGNVYSNSSDMSYRFIAWK